MTLKIDNIVIPGQAGFDVRQTYEPIFSRTLLRAKSGAGIIQSRWKKLRSTINGSGWEGAALDGIDLETSHTVSCVEPLILYSATTSATIPHTYRTDTGYTVQAAALVGDELIPTPVSLAGQAATITAVSGATQYQVIYYPILTAMLTISKSGDIDNQQRSWTIEVEEL